jgi:hypothetical protein
MFCAQRIILQSYCIHYTGFSAVTQRIFSKRCYAEIGANELVLLFSPKHDIILDMFADDQPSGEASPKRRSICP